MERSLAEQILIQEHSLWDVKDGKFGLFWVDSWQQLPKLQDNLDFLPLRDGFLAAHNSIVHLY